jgi:hypothetical protein
MRRALAIWLLLAISASAQTPSDEAKQAGQSAAERAIQYGLPDPVRTPGALNPKVNQDNIKTTICKPGWTKTMRPAGAYFRELKIHHLDEYGFTDKVLGHFEEDHLISLQLGGHPRDPKNLWPQPFGGRWGARIKDVVEGELKRRVCKGEMTLPDAQEMIAGDWRVAYCLYVSKPKLGLCSDELAPVD